MAMMLWIRLGYTTKARKIDHGSHHRILSHQGIHGFSLLLCEETMWLQWLTDWLVVLLTFMIHPMGWLEIWIKLKLVFKSELFKSKGRVPPWTWAGQGGLVECVPPAFWIGTMFSKQDVYRSKKLGLPFSVADAEPADFDTGSMEVLGRWHWCQ